MNKTLKIVAITLCFLLTACLDGQKASNPNSMLTAAAQTVEAQSDKSQTRTANPTTPAPPSATAAAPTPTIPLLTITPTPQPTATHGSNLTPMATLWPTRTATGTRIPTRTPISYPTADRSVPLSHEGPWLVYASQGKMVVVNADGSGRTEVPSPGIIIDPGYEDGWVGSPGGRYVAGIGQIVDTEDKWFNDTALFVVGLPDLSVKVIPLITNPDLATSEGNIALDPGLYYYMAWSPDGQRLAFIASIDGPSTDLYIYNTQTDQITRLTSGLNQAYRPEWSPNGKWIVHREINRWGAGCTESGLWAAAVDGSQVKWLQAPARCVEIAGWTGPETFIAYDAEVMPRDPYKADISSGETLWLYPCEGMLDQPYFNPWTKDTIFLPMPGTDSYIAGPSDSAPRVFTSGIPILENETWLPEMKLLVVAASSADPTCQLTALQENGSHVCFDEYGYPSPSPDGHWFASSGKDRTLRLYSGDGQFVSEIAPNASLFSWQPDSQGFLYQVGNKLYYQSTGGGMTQPVNWVVPGDARPADLIWRSDSAGFYIHDGAFLFYYDLLSGQTLLVDQGVDEYHRNFIWAGKP